MVRRWRLLYIKRINIAEQIILGNKLTSEKKLIKITDVLEEVNENKKDGLAYIYDDGSIERVFIK